MDLTGRTDEQLAQEARREGSDGPAFHCLVQRYEDRVWHICYRLMGNREDASDAAQEVFVKLFLYRDRFEGRSKYSTWVHGVALRTCLTLRRSRGRRQRHETTTESTSELAESRTATPQTGLHLDLMQMLDTLNEEDRAMLILKHAEDYSYEDLAEMFDLSVSACKMRLNRARNKLKRKYPEAFND